MTDDLTQVTVEIATKEVSMEIGTVDPGDWDTRIIDTATGERVAESTLTTLSANLPPGDYVARGSRMDKTTGLAIGGVAENPFRVDSKYAPVVVAGGISVSQG